MSAFTKHGVLFIEDFRKSGAYAKHKLQYPNESTNSLMQYDTNYKYKKYGRQYTVHGKHLYCFKTSHSCHMDTNIFNSKNIINNANNKIINRMM